MFHCDPPRRPVRRGDARRGRPTPAATTSTTPVPGVRYPGRRVASPAVDSPVSARQLLRWSESLAAIARTGLGFTESLYERERFEEVLKVAGEIRASAADALDERSREQDPAGAEGFVHEWLGSVGQGVPGYVTPKVAVGALVGNEAGELLLVRRADSGVWLYPTGWADVGYSPAEVAAKEVWEETGIDVEPLRLVMVVDGLRVGVTQIPLYSLVF